MRYTILCHESFHSLLEKASDYGERPTSAFLISPDEALTSGHSVSAIFCHTAIELNEITFSRVCDFITYENANYRYPVIVCNENADLQSILEMALRKLPAANKVRDTDPKWAVHSTSLINGKAILKDGIIKSQKQLLSEGYFTSYQLGFQRTGEPDDYLEHINFGGVAGIFPENVVRSNQTGIMGVFFDEHYNPGYRFYIDVHKVIKNGLALRTGAPIFKAKGGLSVLDFVSYIVSVEDFEQQNWTPRKFTIEANKLFFKHLTTVGKA